MTLFISGLVLFFGLHLYSNFRSRETGRDLRKKLGEPRFMGLYSVAALAGFALIIIGFGATRPSAALYQPPIWGVHVNMLLMIFALIALIASQIPAGHIKAKLKHPMLVAVKLWALGHLLSNGELNSVILFTAFLAYAVLNRITVKRRGDTGPSGANVSAKWDVVAVIGGFAVYGLFVTKLHALLIGVPII